MIVSFPEWNSDPTKRGILHKLASIYDLLGFVSPVTLGGRCLYHSVCCEKLAWDAELTGTLKIKWQRWKQSSPSKQIAVGCPLLITGTPSKRFSCMALVMQVIMVLVQ